MQSNHLKHRSQVSILPERASRNPLKIFFGTTLSLWNNMVVHLSFFRFHRKLPFTENHILKLR